MKLKAGTAKREITPPAGMDLSGFIARLEPSREVAEPIHVRALVVSDEERKVAIVQADLPAFAPWQVAEVREYAGWQSTALRFTLEGMILARTKTQSFASPAGGLRLR